MQKASRLIASLIFLLAAVGAASLVKFTASTVAGPPHQSQVVDDVSSYGCGVERWSVKTGTDQDAAKVDLSSSTWTSPGRLVWVEAPSSLPTDRRVPPIETTVLRMTVTLLAFKEEADSDIHLQVAGKSGVHMIAELPSPSCTQQNSPFDSRIVSARSYFQSHYGTATGTWKTVNRPIALVGVGFFDFVHGATGQAPNGIELHPVLSIRAP